MRTLLPTLLAITALVTPLAPLSVTADKVGHLEGYQTEVADLVQGTNAFTWDLMQAMRARDESFIVSPFNISSALAMAYVGARGVTAEQMREVLHYPHVAPEVLARDFYLLSSLLTKPNKAFTLSLANGVWIQQDLILSPAYREIIAQGFGGDLFPANFRFPGAAVDQINAFVRTRTEGKIRELLQPNDVDESTRLVLASALYMKAPWAFAFDPRATRTDRFITFEGKSVAGRFMNQVGRFAYGHQEGYSVLLLPYARAEGSAHLALCVILPDATDGLSSVLDQLSVEQLLTTLNRLERRSVQVSLPVFKLSTQVSAGALLQKLGMPNAFTDRADFSGISQTDRLSINKVIHQTTFDVNEYGTEASAATAVSIGLTSAPDKPEAACIVDHPFALAVIDMRSGQLLFLGQVLDPFDN